MSIPTNRSIGDRVSWRWDDAGRVLRSVIRKIEAVEHSDGSVEVTYWTNVKWKGRIVPAFFTDKEIR